MWDKMEDAVPFVLKYVATFSCHCVLDSLLLTTVNTDPEFGPLNELERKAFYCKLLFVFLNLLV